MEGRPKLYEYGFWNSGSNHQVTLSGPSGEHGVLNTTCARFTAKFSCVLSEQRDGRPPPPKRRFHSGTLTTFPDSGYKGPHTNHFSTCRSNQSTSSPVTSCTKRHGGRSIAAELPDDTILQSTPHPVIFHPCHSDAGRAWEAFEERKPQT